MDVLVAGGHGQIGQRLLRLLADRGHRARGLIRNSDHAADIERLGAVAVLGDLEREDVTEHTRGADAVVFAAGAGPGSGPERKRTVDLGGAVKLIEAAGATGVQRYVMVSAMGAADPASGSESMRPYLEAKAEADAALEASGLHFTIVRPGRLTDDAGKGRIAVAARLDRSGEITRDDVAATLGAVLATERTIGRTFELLGGRDADRGRSAGAVDVRRYGSAHSHSTARASAAQTSRIRPGGRAQTRSTRSTRESGCTLSSDTTHDRGSPSATPSATSVGRSRTRVVRGATSGRANAGRTASRESTRTGRRPSASSERVG